MNRAFSLVVLLLALGGCAANLPPLRSAVYDGSVEPIPAAAPVTIGDSLPTETSFSIENSMRVFPRGPDRPAATFDMAIAGEQRIVPRPGGYDLLATITESSLTGDRRMNAESERNMASIADRMRGLDVRMQLDQHRRVVPDSLLIDGVPMAADASGIDDPLPNAMLELFDSLATQTARQPGLELATGDALVSISFPLPDGSEVSVMEVVDGRVTHAGRDAVLFQIDVEVPPDFPLAAAGYSVVDVDTGVVLASQHSLANVVNGIGTETLTTTSHAISDVE